MPQSVRYSGAYAAAMPSGLTITGQPVDTTINTGSTATFTVTAVGTSLTYQWYQGASGVTTTPVSGATSATLTTAALSATTSYWVRVTGSGGTTADSRSATATVLQPVSVLPLGGEQIVEWWAIPSSGTPYVLFDVLDWTISVEGGSRGTVAVTYPAAGPLYATLVAATIGADRDLEVEIRIPTTSGTTALRALLTDSQVDEVAEEEARTWRGPLIGQLMAEAVVYNSSAADGSVAFVGQTAGAIVSALVASAQARGALAGITTTTFSATADSTGQPWPATNTVTLSPGGTYLTVLQELEDAGLLEWELVPVGSSRALRLYGPGRMGIDRTIGTPPLMLHAGRDVTAAARKHSVAGSVTALLGSASGGIYGSIQDVTALARRGRRIEGYVTAAGITSSAGLSAYLSAQLNIKGPGTIEFEHELVVADPAAPRPLVDFGLRDFVLSDGTGQTSGTAEKLRVSQIVLQRSSGRITARVVLGNLIAERIASLARQLQRLQNGSAVIGSSTPGSISNDVVAPNAPTGLTLTSDAIPDGLGGSTAVVFATWAAPTTNTDGTVCNDIQGYELAWQYVTAGYETNSHPEPGGTGLQADFGVPAVGVTISVQVRAYDRSGNRSAYGTAVQITTSIDTTPPPTPAFPTVTNVNGVLQVAWNGQGSLGETMPPDFARVDVFLSTTSGFTPGFTTKRGELRGKQTTVFAGLSYGTTYYVKLVAYDRSGNASAASTEASVVVNPLVGTDLTDAIITAAKLGSQAVTTPKIAPEAVTTPHLSVAAFADTAIPNGTFEDADLTTSTKPALWTLLSSTGATPTFIRDTTLANAYGGTSSLKISLPAASGSALIGSEVIPVRPGDLYYLEVPAFASRAVTGGLSIRAYIDYNNPPVPSNTGVDFLLGTVASLPTLYPGTAFGPAGSPFSVNFGIGNDVGGTGQSPAFLRIVIVAGLVSGDSAALDVWVDQLRLRKVVGTAEIQDASITNAKILNATIQSAKIATVSVGSIVGGTATFSMLMATGDIRSANSGQRWILDPAGLRFYDSAGNNTLDANVSAGTVSIVGAFQTSAGTSRIQLTNSGGPTINLYTSVTTTPMYLRAIADTPNSATTLLIHGPPNTGYSPNRSQKIRVGFNDIVMGWEDVGDAVGTSRGSRFVLQPTSWFFETRSSSSTALDGLYLRSGSGTDTFIQHMIAGNAAGNVQLSGTYAFMAARDSGGTDQSYFLGYTSGRTLIHGTGIDLDTSLAFKLGPSLPLTGTSVNGYDSSARFGMDSAPTSLYLRWNSGSPQWARSDTNATVKTFVADNPLDPARHLVHATVESPAVTNLYTGTARLVRGRVVVELPGYFEAANRREGRVVVLTPMLDDSERVAVVAASYPRDGRFTIRAMGPDCDVSWLVTAVRADVPHLDPEPLRAGNRVRGDGPYTYLVPSGEMSS